MKDFHCYMQHKLVSLNLFHHKFQVKLIWKFCRTDIVCGTGQFCFRKSAINQYSWY